jgi:hypothetical protein
VSDEKITSAARRDGVHSERHSYYLVGLADTVGVIHSDILAHARRNTESVRTKANRMTIILFFYDNELYIRRVLCHRTFSCS